MDWAVGCSRYNGSGMNGWVVCTLGGGVEGWRVGGAEGGGIGGGLVG
jgi:hypothetical protein